MIAGALDTEPGIGTVTSTACAKINLTLDVFGLRDDGFHDLQSLVVGVDLRDRLRLQLRSKPGISLSCSDSSLSGADNLAHRALRALAARCRKEPGAHLELAKTIPVGAGLGGGSSDAATAFRLGDSIWNLGLDRAEFVRLGAAIGSDVPLFFSLPSAVIRGRGDRVTPVRLRWTGWVLLLFAGQHVATVDVFRRWRRADSSKLPTSMEGAIANATSADEVMGLSSNHLEPAVGRVCPEVARLQSKLRNLGVGPMRVSGAGSTLYRLFDDREAACDAAERIAGGGIDATSVVAAAPSRQDTIESGED